MIQLFKNKEKEKEVIEQIHNEFDTAADRLLQQAIDLIEENKGSLKLESDIEEKAERLKKVGFTSNGLVKKLEDIVNRNKQKETVIKISQQQADKINYYKQEYPFYKFLTEQELDRICEKYGLIYVPISRYKMPVPDKNLSEIENRKPIKEEDLVGNVITWEYVLERDFTKQKEAFSQLVKKLGKSEFNQEEIRAIYNEYLPFHITRFPFEYLLINLFYLLSKDTTLTNGVILIADGIKHVENRTGLFIAAPKEHFDLKDLTENKKGFYQRVSKVHKDPIVFEYVRGGVLVSTKWGLEADDPALQNEIWN